MAAIRPNKARTEASVVSWCLDAALLQEGVHGASQGQLGGVVFLCPIFVFCSPISEMLTLYRRWCNSQTLENPLFILLWLWYTGFTFRKGNAV